VDVILMWGDRGCFCYPFACPLRLIIWIVRKVLSIESGPAFVWVVRLVTSGFFLFTNPWIMLRCCPTISFTVIRESPKSLRRLNPFSPRSGDVTAKTLFVILEDPLDSPREALRSCTVFSSLPSPESPIDFPERHA